MKLHIIATAAIAGSLLIGCTDQSSVNSPALESNKMSTSSVLSSVIEVNTVVGDPLTGEEFLVSGTIFYQAARNKTDYSFFQSAELSVQSVAGKYRADIAEKSEQSGVSEEGVVIIPVEYELAARSAKLRIEFSLYGDAAEVSTLSIVGSSLLADEDR